ncbi:FHA domain-containing protein FhaB/FipA [Bifidobacterium avesanii]|uniref:FHA domain-containing protein n=1 Tax=Bifidobacterium avesanii TaxID=1798157 RepID=A0A7K3TJV5_9BIFI|nr:FHA domain-containing protein [Bifidobacterium avesanii]KAB8290118.1 FHA domain-containing protein [Bifidobacterium avesanii]NEG78934.1 FHA domain-containing protein [Bifidobacterium avesanii]
MTELTFALLKYGFLVLLWAFVWLAVHSLHQDIAAFSPKPSRSRRKRERAARRAAEAPVPEAQASAPAPRSHVSARNAGSAADADAKGAPALLVVIDGPLAGATVPLSGEAITIGRAASNTVVLNDEFVSGHHARVYVDPTSGQWAIEDLGSMNGTVVAGQRIGAPTILPARVPVRIGATTLELR